MKKSLSEILKDNFFIIAGPCVIEDEKIVYETAEKLKSISQKLDIPFIFKSSFDKANRSSLDSFRGPGLEKGLKILKKVKEKYNVPILTDVHETYQIKPTSEIADIIQIPAFLCRQTDLLVEAAKSGKIVNVKKGQFLSFFEIENVIGKIRPFTNLPILITERGYMFGYNNLVVDFRSLEVMKKYDCLVIYDATHSTMLPAGKGKESGGDYKMAKVLARAAVAVGINGLFFETHPIPLSAKSDRYSMIPLNEVEEWLKILIEYNSITKKYRFI